MTATGPALSSSEQTYRSGDRLTASAPLSGRISFVILLTLLVAVVSWRPGVYYSGGVDPVVVAKAGLSVLALATAWMARRATAVPYPMGGRTFWLLVAYLSVSAFGGLAAGQFAPSAVLSVRVLIVGLTVILLVRTFPVEQLLRHLFAAMLSVAALASVTGVASISSEGRLFGGVPALHANEIAVLCGLPLLGLSWLVLTGRAKGRHLVVASVALLTIWLTGSRTGLLTVLVASAVMLLLTRRLKPVWAVAIAATVPLGVYAIFASEIAAGFFQRGDSTQIATLSSRTIAWSASWSFPETSWARWMGSGLSQKLIPVQGQWWDTQLLDSTWVSGFIQAGRLGVLIMAAWLLATLVASARSPWRARLLFLPLLTYLVISSFLESGLFDSAPTFITLVLLSLASDGRTRRGRVQPLPSTAAARQEPVSSLGGWPVSSLRPPTRSLAAHATADDRSR